MLPTLVKLLGHTDTEVLTDTCWALSYISDDSTPDNIKISAVITAGVVPHLVRFAQSSRAAVMTPALRTLGNIVTGNDKQTQVVLRAGALPALRSMLVHQKKSIRKEACWTISNITAGNKEQIQAVIAAGIIGPLVAMLRNAQFDVKKEACWAIANAISGGSSKQLEYIFSQSVIEPLSLLFKCHDPKMVMIALEAMEKILAHGATRGAGAFGGEKENKCAECLEECGGLDLIEDLQRHDNEEIYEKAVKILRDYFESDDADDDENTFAAPAVDANAGQFAFGGGFGGGEEFTF
jgi:importin subunit alpha-6/7